MLGFGAMRGETETVVSKAIRLCLECVGIGSVSYTHLDVYKRQVLNKLTMSFDDDGKMTLFADLEKITEKQKERLEELKEKRAEEKKQEKKDVTVKRTTIQANSKEELLEKISELDWSKITEEKATQGMKFDITI